ncbi:hypothetical protein ACTMU2_20865 [Cupriavidus basilensis]
MTSKAIKLLTEYAHTGTSGASTSTDTLQLGAQIPVGSGKDPGLRGVFTRT